jgi:hypothetical protein
MNCFRTFGGVVLAGLTLAVFAPVGANAAPRWKAGVAAVDITPTESIWMAGYGARTKPSEGVLQRLRAKAIALEDEAGNVSVIVTSDLLGFTADMSQEVAERVRKAHGLPRERLILNASHTHSGPVTGQKGRPNYVLDQAQSKVVEGYTAKLIDQVVEVIGESLADRQPAELAFEQGFAGFAVNRRRVGNRQYPGPVDHDVPVLSVRGADGKLKAVLFGYSCHATVLNQYEINGDWPGYAQEALERTHARTVAMFVNGCGADQNPLPRREVWLAQRYGEILAKAVDLVLEAKMRPLAGPIRARYQTVDLLLQEPPSRAEFEKRAKGGDQSLRNHARLMLHDLDKDGKLRDRYPYPVQVWQFGQDLTFISLAGEVVADYSLRLKQEHGWDDTWVSGYNNDVFAYIPSLRILQEGGYEGGGAMIGYGQPAPFRASVEETIVEKVAELVRATAN